MVWHWLCMPIGELDHDMAPFLLYYNSPVGGYVANIILSVSALVKF